ncbi:hypothetical protein APR41_03765 [Salegentibacter salinarum]|uniref:Uncharacterized protein n=1 Tax=Salegentibacter salinarum TaxID=447422 RepID=A0A2N0TU59_9FLAO|nr:hypothetical protein APR41_03765 [Salegentibacter salinarum]
MISFTTISYFNSVCISGFRGIIIIYFQTFFNILGIIGIYGDLKFSDNLFSANTDISFSEYVI